MNSFLERSAKFSPCGTYRYELWRKWDNAKPHCMFCLLNPSTANEHFDDPTIRRLMGFAARFGFGGFVVANLFGFRSAYPKEMRAAPEPIGPDNDATIDALAKEAGLIVAAWGNGGTFKGRDKQVMERLKAAGYTLRCIRKLPSGNPEHPLYIPAETNLIDL